MLEAAEGLLPSPHDLTFLGRKVKFLDAFSANDPKSLCRMWTEWRWIIGDTESWSVLFNTRSDRPLRTRQFCDWLAAREDVGRVHVTGSHREAAVFMLRRRGLDARGMADDTSAFLPTAAGSASRDRSDAVLVGIGNIQNLGVRLRAFISGGVQP
jgi:hypothetical protein